MPLRRTPISERLLVEITSELGKGSIRELFIAEKGLLVHGQCDGTVITINPTHDTVDTLVHELLHRRYPAWSELYVRRTTSYIMARLSDVQRRAIYSEYQRTVRRPKRRVLKMDGP